MAISIDWPSKIIHVPKADMTLIQVSPEIRELDLYQLHLTLRDLEDDPIGIVFPRTHRHNAAVSLGGITYAATIEIINGYTITFEDDQYAVNLVGANSNVGDVVNVNQVSVRSANAAGLVIVNSGSGLSAKEKQQLEELWKIRGLDKNNPVTVTPAQEVSGNITIKITGDGVNTSTGTRQP